MRKRNGGVVCPKPAKFRVWFGDGPALAYCGVHANQAKRRPKANVVPVTEGASES